MVLKGLPTEGPPHLTSFYDHHVDIFVQDDDARQVQLASVGFYLEFLGRIAEVPDPGRRKRGVCARWRREGAVGQRASA